MLSEVSGNSKRTANRLLLPEPRLVSTPDRPRNFRFNCSTSDGIKVVRPEPVSTS